MREVEEARALQGKIFSQAKIRPACLESITDEMVIEKVKEVLSEN